MKRACLRLAKAAAMLITLSAPAHADFSSCVASLRADAARAGTYPATTLDAAFGALPARLEGARLPEGASLEFKTPGLRDYLATLVDEERVSDGKARMTEYASALATAEQRYGVSRYVIAAIWGVESDFGHSMGKRSLVQSLSTLACFGERASYFRGVELSWRALKIVANGDIPIDKLNGSLGGRVRTNLNSCPRHSCGSRSTSMATAGDGHCSISKLLDALGSTANYLHKSGWRPGGPWGFEIKLPAGYSGPSGRRNKAPMSAWAARGLARVDGRPLGRGAKRACSLPAGLNGPTFLVTSNFDAIYSYNASESYALAIAALSDRLAGGGPFATPWPTDDPGLSRAERRELQKLLIARGYDVGEPDGAVGKKTKDAIADFESKNGLDRDGRPSAKVLAALRR